MQLPLGELSALGSALFWALNAILLRPLTSRVAALRITSLQYAVVAVFTLGMAGAFGRLDSAAAIPLLQAGALVGSAFIGMGAGDTSYVRALGILGVARSFTFATSGYVLVATATAAAFLGEPVTSKTIVGAAVLLAGLWVVVRASEAGKMLSGDPEALDSTSTAASEKPEQPAGDIRLGLALCAVAALCWAFTSSVLKLALVDVDVLAANALRIPAVALLLNAASLRYHRFTWSAYSPRIVLVTAVAGILGLGLGSLLFLYGIQEAGAAKTAILSSTSPLFAAVLAPALLRERLSRGVAAGTALSVAGTWLVV